MKAMKYLLAVCAAAAIAASLRADVDPAYQTAMKTAAAACQRLKKNVDAKANPEEMAKDAEEVAQNFRKMGGYWKQKQVDDAMQASREAFGAAMAISKAAKAGNMDEAAAQFKTLSGTCAGCHKAHRDKNADGTYSMK
jgi:cytochrome c556